MANVKITALSEITPSATDVLPVVDVSANVTSKTTVANIPKNASNGTAATPSHSFASDTDTGMWRRLSNTLAFSTGGTQKVELASDGDVLIGGTLPSAPAISLNNNGSSTFLGELTVNRPTGQASALVIRENNVEKIKLKPNGQALFSGPVSIGGTAAINTIDVYEEGSFTPSVEFGGSATGVTYSSRIGKFTRIGDQVTVYVFVALSDKGTSTGNAIIKTLPFTSANIVANNLVGWPGVVAARQQNFSGLDVNNPNIGITVARNGVGMLLRTVSGVNLTDANFTNGSIIEYQLTYTTN